MMNNAKKVGILALSAAMLAGCGGSSSNSKSTTFRFASDTDILSMDTDVATDGTSFDAIHAITDGLEIFDAKGNTAAGIAKSYDVNKKKTVYTFHLRDANWVDYNGKKYAKVTANDFVYGWQRILKNAGEYAYMMGSQGANIKNADKLMELGTKATQKQLNTLGVKAKDDKTLVVTLASPVPFFIDLLTFPCFYPVNQKFVESKGKEYASSYKDLLSNSAFIMTGWTKGKSATFVKNKSYWDASKVKLQSMKWQLGLDAKSAAASFDAGNLDYAPLTSAIVDKYKKSKSYYTYTDGFLHYLDMNINHYGKNTKSSPTVQKALKNKNIRKALSLAINRQELCTKILKDGSTESNGFVPKGLCKSPKGVDYRADVKEDYTSYNLKEAQKAFDKGMKEIGAKSLTLSVLYGTDEISMKDVAVYVQSCWSKLKGLKLNMVATVKQDRVNNREPKGDFEISVTRWGPDYADPTTYLNLCMTGNAQNRGQWSNKKYDAIMAKVQTESNLQKRWDLMKKAEKIAMEDYAKIPLFDKGGAALKNTKVKGLVHKSAGVPYTFEWITMD